MKFTIALYGSFKDTAGYSWKLPHGYAEEQFDNISRKFSKLYDDGRQLDDGDLYGGYYIDLQRDLFYAFRFINGGEDALGRSGVVITNWAITQYSKVVGKDISILFDNLTLKQMPKEDYIEVPLKNSFNFSNLNSSPSFESGTERIWKGEEAKNILLLSEKKYQQNILVQFAMKENQKEASMKFMSPVSEAIEQNERKHNASVSSRKKEGEGGNLLGLTHRKKGLMVLLGSLLIVIVIGSGICFGWKAYPSTRKSDCEAILMPSEDSSGEVSRKEPHGGGVPSSELPNDSDVSVMDSPPSFPPSEIVASKTEIKQGSWIVLTPFCCWMGKKHKFSMDVPDINRYSWGELRVFKSKLEISFAAHITLKENNKEEYKIFSNNAKKNQPIGEFKILNKGWSISFSTQHEQQGKGKLSGVFDLQDKSKQKCGQLTITDSSIDFRFD